MVPIAGTPQECRIQYLKLAAEAETSANKLTDQKAKAAWIDLAVTWVLMASEISEIDGDRKQLSGGAHYWMRVT